MDKQHYLAEGYRQLNNPLHYVKLSRPLYPQTATKFKEIITNLFTEHLLTDREFKFLLPPSDPRPRRFYMLPKTHKPKESWSFPNKMPPGRPIVSDCNSASKNISGLIDFYLKDLANRHPSYIKNTYDFVDKISKLNIPKQSLLITLDVESMYTNINHDKGILAVKEAFGRSNLLYDSIIDLLELALRNNDFIFNNEWFLQVTGTAMGADYAPHYADIYMAKFEKEALEKCPLKPHTYLRFLDDIFIIWPHSIEAFHEFLSILNNHEPPIKFKYTINTDTVDYLDTTIFKNENNNGKLLTRVYFKPTDTHQLLHKESFHPKHTFKGILKSQIIRFHRICSKQKDFETACSILFQAVRKRNYSKRWLRNIKAETLRQLIMKARRLNLCNPTTSKCGARPCGIERCKTCEILPECQTFICNGTENTYAITGQLNCESSNIIYVLHCLVCNKQYVGETGTMLRERVNHHRSAIRNNHTDSALSIHLDMHVEQSKIPSFERTLENCFDVIPIEQLPDLSNKTESKNYRLERETYWIDTLGTIEPQGLNKKRFGDTIKKSPNDPIVPFVVPFSKTADMASRIIKKHFSLLVEEDYTEGFDSSFPYRIISAYCKHKNISGNLVRSKT